MSGGIRLLGTPAVLVAGEWITLRAGKSGALFTFVAHRGVPVRRAEVASLIWPDADQERAHTNLRQLLRRLSDRSLGSLIDRDETAVWTTKSSDVHAFSAAVDAGHLEAAASLYRGMFLDGFEHADAGEFGSWVLEERAALEGRWRRICLALIEESVAVGLHERVLDLAERLLRADPFDELALRRALRAQAAFGDLHGANRRFEAFRKALLVEFGVEPESETLAVAAELAGGPRSFQLRPQVAASSLERTARGLGLATLAPRVRGRHRLIGRETELTELTEVIQVEDTRLVTLLAPGGMGKSTLAAALVDEISHTFADGVITAPLDGVRGPAAVEHALASASGLSLDPAASPRNQVVAALSPRHALVVLDGFESHIDEVGLVDTLVRCCPNLKILVTSRLRLKHSVEVVFEVGPLRTQGDTIATPDYPSALRPSDAARLFVRAASQTAARVRLGPEHSSQVERICSAVGGNPLAVELTVGRLDVLTLNEIEARTESSWELLSPDAIDRPRHRSDVLTTIEETYRNLDEIDRAAWERLAVLPGTIDKTVAAVVAGSGWRGLRRLADRAVIRQRGERLELHALLARFGRERAALDGNEVAAHESLLQVWSERLALEVDPRTGLRYRVHSHDLAQAIEAWHWAIAHGRWEAVGDMAFGLLRALDLAARGQELGAAVAAALNALDGISGRARDRALARILTFEPGDAKQRAANARRALALAESFADHKAMAAAHATLLMAEPSVNAGERYAMAREQFALAGDHVGLAKFLMSHAEYVMLLGRVAEAESMLNEALELYRALDDRIGQAIVIDLLTSGPLMRAEVETARQGARLAHEMFQAEGAVYRGSGTLATEFWIALVLGDRGQAAALLDEFVAVEERFSDARIRSAVQRCSFHARFGEHEQVVFHSRKLLELLGADNVDTMTLYPHQRLARALVATGDIVGATRHLRTAVRMTRALGAPRFVPKVAHSAGALAVALGRTEEALDLLALAWHHPAAEVQVYDDLRDILNDLGVRDEPAPPPERQSYDLMLGLVERFVESVTDSPNQGHPDGAPSSTLTT